MKHHSFLNFRNSYSKRHICNAGFSLVELLITLSIVVIISTIALIDYPKYGAGQLLQLTMQELAVTIRETQVYGIAVREGTPEVFEDYGVYIDIDHNGDNFTGLSTNEILVFADVDGTPGLNKGPTPQDLVLSKIKISLPNKITNVCFNETGGDPSNSLNESCWDDIDGGTFVLDGAEILFQRPEPEPKIYDGSEAPSSKYVYVRIEISNTVGSVSNLYIWKTGQISVVNPNSS